MIDFSKLVPLYLEPHRYYHNLQHIHAMLRELYLIRSEPYNKVGSFNWNSVTATIWYHDCYYDPLAPHGFNEEMSAQLYITHCEPDYSGGSNVILMIEASAYHGITQDIDCETTKLFLDLDMHFMGLGPIAYNRNVSNIEREYLDTGISFEQFRKGRIQFLEALMKRYINDGSIFYTEYFKQKYSKQANTNILTELNSLRNP